MRNAQNTTHSSQCIQLIQKKTVIADDGNLLAIDCVINSGCILLMSKMYHQTYEKLCCCFIKLPCCQIKQQTQDDDHHEMEL